MTTVINSNQVHYQVFVALDEKGYLPINEKISLEYLTSECDGIFPSLKSWKSFIRGNFLNGNDFVNIKDSTIKKWCAPITEYNNRFVVKIGNDKFITVCSDDLEYKFDYECYYSDGDNFPTEVEFFITARIK